MRIRWAGVVFRCGRIIDPTGGSAIFSFSHSDPVLNFGNAVALCALGGPPWKVYHRPLVSGSGVMHMSVLFLSLHTVCGTVQGT